MYTLDRIISSINPLILYIPIIYGVCKYIQEWFQTESVFQFFWSCIRENYGIDSTFYLVWFGNTFVFVLYWTLGLSLFAMEKFKVPKTLENYKIQQRQSEVGQSENFFKVRQYSFYRHGHFLKNIF